jgi:sulfite exporter TauE/SafE/plastocyanin domain-containing protein/copper chaperone CopZ
VKENTVSWAHLMEERNKDQGRTIQLIIGGMTCESCERRITEKLKKMDGVQEADVSYVNSTARITFNETKTSAAEIGKAIEGLGYSAADEKARKSREEGFSKLQLAGIGIIALALFIVLDRLGVFRLVPEIQASMSYGLLFITGLLTSVHCLAMCGGINLSQSLDAGTGKKTRVSQILPGILYNSGRVISYTVIGMIVGGLGSVFSISKGVQTVLVVIAGVFMVIMGLNFLGVFPFLKKISIPLPRFIKERVPQLIRGKGPFLVGLLNGLMPCGPLQSMQIYALGSGGIVPGGLSMLFFSLGTVPLMLGFSVFNTFLSRKFQSRMLKVGAMLVMMLGVVMVGRGLNLSGIGFQPAPAALPKNVARLGNGYQTVETTLSSGEYEPLVVQKGVPVKWTINADSASLNGCNNPVTVPRFNIVKKMVPGANLIEFTPDAPGDITYTCWMGMITSHITVVDDLASLEPGLLNQNQQAGESTFSPPPDLAAAGLPGTSNESSGKTTAADQAISPNGTVGIARIKGGGQEVETRLSAAGYPPIIVQKGIPVTWKFQADARDLTTCNNALQIPDLGITRRLVAGENTIQFTPDKAGRIGFTCWMGMIKSSITVVDDLSKVDNSVIADAEGSAGGSSSGCCSTSAGNTAAAPLVFKIDSGDIRIASIEGGVQRIDVEVRGDTYSPSVIVLRKGVTAEINYRASVLNDDNYRILIPAYNGRIQLQEGDNTIKIESAADFFYMNWKQKFFGLVLVVDDPAKASSSDLRAKAERFVPALP